MNISINNLLARFSAPFLLLFLALVTFPRTAEAVQKTQFKTEGVHLFAPFTSSVGSINLFARVEVVQNVTKSNGQKTGFAQVILQRFDSSTSTQISGSGFVEENFVIEQKSNLRSATLRVTIPVDFFINNPFPGQFFRADVMVDLTWTGVGPITRVSSRNSSNTFDTISIFKSTGIFRSAEAIGSVIASTPNGDINFTPGPSDPDLTSMDSTDQGTLVIIKLK